MKVEKLVEGIGWLINVFLYLLAFLLSLLLYIPLKLLYFPLRKIWRIGGKDNYW